MTGWPQYRIKDVAQLISVKADDLTLPYIALDNIISWDATFVPSGSTTDGNSNLCNAGDVLFGKLRPYLAKAYIPSEESICSPEFLVLRPNKGTNNKFLLYFLLSKSFISHIRNQVAGVKMPRTNWSQLSCYPIRMPSLAEHEASASYLDKECEKIGREIELLERKVEAYGRLRRSLINRAVTRGLNPNAPLKPSFFTWFEAIQMGWSYKRMKDVSNFGRALNIKKSDLSEEGKPVVSYGQIHSKSNTYTAIDESLIRFVPSEFCIDDNCKITKGNFIVADTSEDLEGCGNMIFNNSYEELWVGYHSYSLKFFYKNIIPEFLAYEFCSETWRCFIRSQVKAVKVFSVTKGIIRDVPVFIPPLQEQKEIVAYLDEKCAKIDAIIEKTGTKIERLKELKRSLINETVTGQRAIIKV